MNFNTKHILFICFLLSVFSLTYVAAVTDAELEALEKQIEQQEAEEKKQAEAKEKKKAEAEAKRKSEQKRKTEAEAEKKRLVELEKQRQEEEKRLAELERKRQEEAKIRAEEEKKEKYTSLIAGAEQAVSNKDKELAINKYNEALALVPGDTVANSGIREAEKLKHKICYDVLGVWRWKGKGGISEMTIKEDGTIIAPFGGTWECSDPKNRIIGLIFPLSSTLQATLSEDGKCLKATWFGEHCFLRPGDKSESGQQSESQSQQVPFGL